VRRRGVCGLARGIARVAGYFFRLGGDDGGAGFFGVALERVTEADDEGFVGSELAGDLLGFEVGELVGEWDARQVCDLPSVADAVECEAEAHQA
jgi:hypothetical protein